MLLTRMFSLAYRSGFSKASSFYIIYLVSISKLSK